MEGAAGVTSGNHTQPKKGVASGASTTSYWLDSARPQFPAIESSLEVDIAVIGAGITGLTAAYLLKKLGKRVAVFDRGLIAGADSGHTTAHLTYVTDERLTELIKNFGKDDGPAAWDAGKAALEQIHTIVHDEKIDCGFKRLSGFFHRGRGKDTKDDMFAEWRAAVDNGFDAAFYERTPLFGDCGVEYFQQALFHPVSYLHELARRIDGDGSRVFENSEAGEISDEPLRVIVNGREVSCGRLLVATNTPLQGTQSLLSAALLQTKLYPYTSYVIRALLETRDLPSSSYWDSAEPYNYLRIDPQDDGTFVILGGQDCKTGQDSDPTKRYRELEEQLRQMFPVKKITHRWLGQVITTNDGLPYIGYVTPGCFIATGYVGNGYTFGTLAGMMFAESVVGVASPWKDLFDPHRHKIIGGTRNYLRENLDYPYYFLKDRLRFEEEISPTAVKPGEGRVVRFKGRRIAVHRKLDGDLVLLSPSCTHLGCLVHWNQADSTWDCPCHGSRFGPTGDVRAGPAEDPLKKFIP